MVDDIRLADVLRTHGARATFNLNSGHHENARSRPWKYKGEKEVWRLALGELREAYQGFTIANHSVSHPWPTRIPLETWRSEVLDGRKWLQDFFGAPVLGFAYPFGDFNEATADVVREAGHVYGRTVRNATPCYPPADPAAFHPDCHFRAADFWERHAAAKASGTGVFYFWGHSYELITEADWQAFEAQIARLSADADTVWTELPELFV